MLTIPLSNDPNQEFEFVYGEHIYNITLKTFRDMTYANVYVDDVISIAGARCVKDGWIIVSPDYASGVGNFRFECEGDEYPYYENFEKTCYLRFYTPEEINV